MKISLAIGLAAAGVIGASPVAVGTVGVPFTERYAPPADCRAYYDGCNMCERTVDGVATCTHRVCPHYGKGFCRARFPDISKHSHA